ncbi:DUF6314 family protein [Nocardioides sp. SYSU D00038]|uniref:DUF6314 family protein n=1 Tax=Nocardioides sp. SYSU D00038 TaxID=2812554 RepID=UPI001967DA6C|nr:DUF6314 family protein [Nocardioides sp. SYSU D00038]
MTPPDLLGTWRMERTVDDRVAGRRLALTATLTLTDEPDGRVRWHEAGTVDWWGDPAPFTRTLFAEQRPDGWWLTFDDGRDFVPWVPGERVDHPCGADHYAGLLEPLADGWSVRWEVAGPAKDYTMVSRLTR